MDKLREKFLEKFPEPTNHIYAHQQAELYEQWHDRWRVYQAAYAQAISEFEQVGYVSAVPIKTPQAIRSDANEVFNIPLYTRKDK